MSAVMKLSAQAYLEQERRSDSKHEFINGEIFAMSGASFAHNLITANVIAALHTQLKNRPCRVLPSDQRVQVQDGYVYPDITVVCGQPQFFDNDNLTNPILIIEVLSPSTADYDNGAKFARYRQLLSVQDYVLVAQDCAHVMHYARQADNRWLLTEYRNAQAQFHLPHLECALSLEDIYAKVFIA